MREMFRARPVRSGGVWHPTRVAAARSQHLERDAQPPPATPSLVQSDILGIRGHPPAHGSAT